MDNFLSEFYLGKHRDEDEYVLVRAHHRHMSNGSVVFIAMYPRRKWGTRK